MYKSRFLLNQKQISQLTNQHKRKVCRSLKTDSFHIIKNTKYYNREVVKKFAVAHALKYPEQLNSTIQFASSNQEYYELVGSLATEIGLLMQFFYETVKMKYFHPYDVLDLSSEGVVGDELEFVRLCGDFMSKIKKSKEGSVLQKGVVPNRFLKVEQALKYELNKYRFKRKLCKHFFLECHWLEDNKNTKDYIDFEQNYGVINIFATQLGLIPSDTSINFLVMTDKCNTDSSLIYQRGRVDGIIDCSLKGVFQTKDFQDLVYYHCPIEQELLGECSIFGRSLVERELFTKLAPLAYFLAKVIESKNEKTLKVYSQKM